MAAVAGTVAVGTAVVGTVAVVDIDLVVAVAHMADKRWGSVTAPEEGTEVVGNYEAAVVDWGGTCCSVAVVLEETRRVGAVRRCLVEALPKEVTGMVPECLKIELVREVPVDKVGAGIADRVGKVVAQSLVEVESTANQARLMVEGKASSQPDRVWYLQESQRRDERTFSCLQKQRMGGVACTTLGRAARYDGGQEMHAGEVRDKKSSTRTTRTEGME